MDYKGKGSDLDAGVDMEKDKGDMFGIVFEMMTIICVFLKFKRNHAAIFLIRQGSRASKVHFLRFPLSMEETVTNRGEVRPGWSFADRRHGWRRAFLYLLSLQLALPWTIR